MKIPFERIVETYAAAVFRVCRAVLGPTDVDDAWSETFLAALRAYPELADDANVEAWLVTIAHRKSLDVARAHKRRRTVVDRFQQQGVAGTESKATSDTDLDPMLWDAVARLPLKQRQAVAYHYLGGLPYKEIAILIGGSAEAVRRAAADGIGALRAAFVTPVSGRKP